MSKAKSAQSNVLLRAAINLTLRPHNIRDVVSQMIELNFTRTELKAMWPASYRLLNEGETRFLEAAQHLLLPFIMAVLEESSVVWHPDDLINFMEYNELPAKFPCDKAVVQKLLSPIMDLAEPAAAAAVAKQESEHERRLRQAAALLKRAGYKVEPPKSKLASGKTVIRGGTQGGPARGVKGVR